MAHSLTPLQRHLLEEVARYWRKHGFSPSIRDLVEKTGTPSTSMVARRLKSLRAHGLLTFYPMTTRSIVLTDAGWRALGLERTCYYRTCG